MWLYMWWLSATSGGEVPEGKETVVDSSNTFMHACHFGIGLIQIPCFSVHSRVLGKHKAVLKRKHVVHLDRVVVVEVHVVVVVVGGKDLGIVDVGVQKGHVFHQLDVDVLLVVLGELAASRSQAISSSGSRSRR